MRAVYRGKIAARVSRGLHRVHSDPGIVFGSPFDVDVARFEEPSGLFVACPVVPRVWLFFEASKLYFKRGE